VPSNNKQNNFRKTKLFQIILWKIAVNNNHFPLKHQFLLQHLRLFKNYMGTLKQQKIQITNLRQQMIFKKETVKKTRKINKKLNNL